MNMLRFRRFLGLSTLLVMPLLASPAQAQEVEITDTCRSRFRAGVSALTDPDGAKYEEAYRNFRLAYDECPSWKIAGNLGISAMKLERDGEAIEAYEKALKEGELTDDERSQYTRDLNTLKTGLVTVKITLEPEGAAIIDKRTPSRGAPIVNRYKAEGKELTLGIHSGHHLITVSVPGYESQTWEFDGVGGQTLDHSFKLEKPKEDTEVVAPPPPPDEDPDPPPDDGVKQEMERPIPMLAYVTGGVTVLGLAGFAVLGTMASGKKSDFDDANQEPITADDQKELQGLKDDGEQLNLFADISLGLGLAAGVVTTILILNRPEVPAQQDTALHVAPAIGPRSAGVSMFKRF